MMQFFKDKVTASKQLIHDKFPAIERTIYKIAPTTTLITLTTDQKFIQQLTHFTWELSKAFTALANHIDKLARIKGPGWKTRDASQKLLILKTHFDDFLNYDFSDFKDGLYLQMNPAQKIDNLSNLISSYEKQYNTITPDEMSKLRTVFNENQGTGFFNNLNYYYQKISYWRTISETQAILSNIETIKNQTKESIKISPTVAKLST